MSRGHNIVGCEATDRDRLVAFSHVHGAMTWGHRSGRRRAFPLIPFLAGVVVTIAVAALLARTGH